MQVSSGPSLIENTDRFEGLNSQVVDDFEIKSPKSNEKKEKTLLGRIGSALQKAMESLSKTFKEGYDATLKFIQDHPKLISVTKKIISIAALSFFFVYHPIYAPIVVIALGILFSEEFEPAAKKYHAGKIDDYFNNLDERDKALIAAAAAAGVDFRNV